MTRLFDDPATFSEDALAGFLDAFPASVVGVPGGVVRRSATRRGKVAVVVGGGSGHYPAFCGVVGPGFADGAVVGNVFTSPSASDAASVGRAASGGGGVLLTTGNYAGDVLNFTLAAQQLEREGIPARYVAVTDDVASAPASERERRRGIAGDFTVFKCAGAAAEEGMDLDAVERVARHANDRTRSLGVAFAGCTLPGAGGPLFTVPAGTMGLGLGIHGEPGVSEAPVPSATELGRTLVDGLLAEAPPGAGRRVTAILNGLGTTKYEELFIVWGSVSRQLRQAGLEVVEPEVGELVTSLDMAGCSLTLMWLDEELERLWCAPADSPAHRKGRLADAAPAAERPPGVADAGDPHRGGAAGTAPASAPEPAGERAREAGWVVTAALDAVAARMADAEEVLGRLDAVAGDGDHGRGMVRGSAAARDAAAAASRAGAGAGSVLRAAGGEWAARAGGTSGVLWGELLATLGEHVGDADAPDAAAVAGAVQQGLEALVRLGGARPGDKTMLDVLAPFSGALDAAVRRGEGLPGAWATASGQAGEAARATAAMVPRVGRARPLAERSRGSADPGAVSLAMVVDVVAGILAEILAETPADEGAHAGPPSGEGSAHG